MALASDKIQVRATITRDLYGWLELQAAEVGLPPSRMVTVLLNEAKKSRENGAALREMMSKYRSISPEDFQALVDKELAKMRIPGVDEVV